MTKMNRIVGHWTGGSYGVAPIELDSYHYLILQHGIIKRGLDPVVANIPPLRSGHYAAHTKNLNSYSIGVAIDAMHGARERPFTPGLYPITLVQVEEYATLVAELAHEYGIPITRETILTHAEVEPTLGVKQNSKWDITWLPGMEHPKDPVVVGDILRDKIKEKSKVLGYGGKDLFQDLDEWPTPKGSISPKQTTTVIKPNEEKKKTFWEWLFNRFF